jgi:putative nucleotidyltransferase with HDIG domain
MSGPVPTRAEVWDLLCEYNQTPSLRRHALAVEAVMRHIAAKHGEDVEMWGAIGLIHDLDYEQWPQEHCRHTPRILREHGWPEPWIRAVLSHAWGICTDVEPQTPLENTLYAIDELTGLVSAATLVRPSRRLDDLTVKSVKKKWNQKGFAAGVDRGVIEAGARRLGLELEALIAEVIAGMQPVAAELGLAGDAG